MSKQPYYEWTKRLGQQHWENLNSNTGTFCGKPMLGNNYANLIMPEHKEPCERCVKAIFEHLVELELTRKERKDNAEIQNNN